MRYSLVVIGASWGGMKALREILAGLPVDFPVPIAIVLHRQRRMGEKAGERLCYLLQAVTALTVQDVVDKTTMEPGRVYLAPPDYHLLMESGYFSLTVEEPVQFSRPSIDVLFESAAEAYGDRTIGVILTGANRDGADGLARIGAEGGATIVQDPTTAENPIMPRAALETVPRPDRLLPLEAIADALIQLTQPVRTTPPGGRPDRRPSAP